jgi:hypothetical protein
MADRAVAIARFDATNGRCEARWRMVLRGTDECSQVNARRLTLERQLFLDDIDSQPGERNVK